MLSAKNILAMIGLSEMLTGMMLVICPQLVLDLLLINSGSDTLYLRFVGAFVFAVGTLYMVPLFDKSLVAIMSTIWSTSILRINISLFLLIMIVLDFFHLSWGVVALYDGIVASIQLYFVHKANL